MLRYPGVPEATPGYPGLPEYPGLLEVGYPRPWATRVPSRWATRVYPGVSMGTRVPKCLWLFLVILGYVPGCPHVLGYPEVTGYQT